MTNDRITNLCFETEYTYDELEFLPAAKWVCYNIMVVSPNPSLSSLLDRATVLDAIGHSFGTGGVAGIQSNLYRTIIDHLFVDASIHGAVPDQTDLLDSLTCNSTADLFKRQIERDKTKLVGLVQSVILGHRFCPVCLSRVSQLPCENCGFDKVEPISDR